jgi:Domain of unknown function (DUF1906)
VIYGITTARAHLDPLDPIVYPLDPTAREIDWSELVQWLWEADSSTGLADFAGRYFLGSATEAEVQAGSGFCLWAHGEASDPDTPARIVPLQRADPVRQGTTGDDGVFFGFQDATALAEHLDRCLAVGDLEIAGTKQILVFLEVGDGTPLSVEYWAAWATTVHDAILSPARLADRTGAESVQPLVPAVLCAFAFDNVSETFLPEPGVRACLDQIGPSGFRTHCHGLWARRLPGDPGLLSHTFSWSNIGEYRQPRPILGLAAPYMQRVPVRYLRWFDGPEGLPIPEGPLRETLSLLTIDWPASDGESPLGATFTATSWRADRRDNNRFLLEMPSQLGIDAGAPITAASATCLGRTDIVVESLPYRVGGMRVNLSDPCSFAVRYYRPRNRGTPLDAAEAQALSLNGVEAVAVLQGTARLTQGTARYVRDLIAPFVNGEGRAHGLGAFTYAADTIQQPPYTPIYFAIDFPVGDPGYQPLPRGADPDDPINEPVPTPSIATILAYFQDVHRGHRDYLTTHPETPYYVGVYFGWDPDAAAALYRAGLASHFWQTPWGRGAPFPHLNVWQIGMFSTPAVLADNPALQACAPPGATQPGKIWADIDAAWGDPGGFSVR